MTIGIVVVASLGRQSGWRAPSRDDHVNLEPDQLGREFRQALGLPLGGPELDDEVLALDVAELAKPLAEGLAR